jgi:hypothetical protein
MTKERAIVRRFQSKKFIFCVQVKGERRKIFQVFLVSPIAVYMLIFRISI